MNQLDSVKVYNSNIKSDRLILSPLLFYISHRTNIGTVKKVGYPNESVMRRSDMKGSTVLSRKSIPVVICYVKERLYVQFCLSSLTGKNSC